MSYRQDLRAAELEVIRSAEKVVGGTRHVEVADYVGITFDADDLLVLKEHVTALQALRADLNAPTAPSSDDDTSANAARMALPMVGGLRRKIVYEVNRRMRWPIPGATVDQLCRVLDRKHQSVSSAVNFLRDTGWLVDSGQRTNTSSGRAAANWVLTDFGRDKVVDLAFTDAARITRQMNA